MSRGVARRPLLIATAGVALVLPAAASTSASSPEHPGILSRTNAVVPMHGTEQVKPGGQASFKLAFPTKAACSASFAGRELKLETSEFDHMELLVRVGRRAGPAIDTFTVACRGSAPAHFPVVVGARRGRGTHFAIPGISFSVRPISRRLPSFVEATATAQAKWASEGAQILAGFRSGQCTDWAAQKRPDVVQRVFEATVVAELLQQPEPPQLNAAQDWSASAAAAGLVISDRPQAGALVVWQEGIEGANAQTGHIGYVESVSPDGSTFSTSEMNIGAPYEMGYREVSTEPVAGRNFIL